MGKMAPSRTRPLVAIAAAVVGMLLLGVATTVPVRGGGHAIEIVDFAFSPATLTIAVGDTVTWTNSDPVVHTATAGSGAFDSGDLDTGESYSVTFTIAGTYDYLCTPHPTMTGRIVVERIGPASAPPPSGSGAIPDVAMRAPGPSPLQVAGIGLLLMSVLAAGLVGWSRRTR